MANVKLIPYLYFGGTCEAALEHYARALGGETPEIKRYAGSPMDAPESYGNKVLHGRLSAGGNTLMACDVPPESDVAEEGRFELAVEVENEADARRIFASLAEGGQVSMPLEKQFWGALYGKCVDRFGLRWMVNCPLEDEAS